MPDVGSLLSDDPDIKLTSVGWLLCIILESPAQIENRTKPRVYEGLDGGGGSRIHYSLKI